MEKIIKTISKLMVLVIALVCVLSIEVKVMAATVYTKGLNKGDKLKLVADGWNVYSTLSLAQAANSSKASSTLKKGQTFEILEINSNVLKIGNKKYIYYGKTGASSFERISAAITGVKLNETSITIKVGEKFTLVPTVTPSNVKNAKVNWESSNKSIAKVSTKGVVTARKEGEAVITVTTQDGNKTAKCNVKVLPDITLAFKKDREIVEYGETLDLTKKLKIKNAKLEDIEWISSNEKAATVENGIITTKGTTTTKITAKIGEVETTCKVTVVSPNVKINKVTISPKSKTINVGEKIELTTTVKTKPDKEVNKKVTYKSSDETIATVSANGVVKALKAGKVNITVTSLVDEKKSATCKLTIKQPVTAINLVGSKTIYVKDKITLEAGVMPLDATKKDIKWTTSDKSIATVSQKGLVTAKKAGTVTITVTAKDGSGVSASCKITVIQKPSYNGVELEYSARYNVCKTPLTKRAGVKWYNGHKETFYSQKVLPGRGLTALNNNGRHVADDGTIRDQDGYIAVACNYLPQGSRIMTSLGPGKVYDTGTMTGEWIDIYVNW